VSDSYGWLNKTEYMVTFSYEHRRNAADIRIGNKTYEAVQSFQYLGNVIVNTNNNNKCIKERIMMGNKTYYANRQLVNSSLISRSSKLQIYRTLVLPKQALQYKPKGRRNIGRPRKRWRDQLHLEDQGTGNTPKPSVT